MPTQRQLSDKREHQIAKEEGGRRVVASGSTSMKKEDVQYRGVLQQDKRSSSKSQSIKLEDFFKLEYHALNAGKLPVFSFAFDNTEIDYVAFPRWWLKDQGWWRELKKG